MSSRQRATYANANLQIDSSPIDDEMRYSLSDQSGLSVAYLRVSTEMQSVDNQRLQLQYLMQSQGVDLDEVVWLEEDGVSATKYPNLQDRPQGKKLVELIISDQVERLFVVDLDRLWRNPLAALLFVSEVMENHPLKISTPSMPFLDLNSGAGFEFFGGQVVRARAEAMRHGERTQRQKETARKQDRRTSHGCFGWADDMDKSTWGLNKKGKVVPKKLIPNWDQIAVLEWVKKFGPMGKNHYSWEACAKKLTEWGVPTYADFKSMSGRRSKWRHATLIRMVKSKQHEELERWVHDRPKDMPTAPFDMVIWGC